MDTVSAMQMFVEVVRSESFSATARYRGIAPSSVTRQIDALERSLEVRLLNRTTRNLALTQAGRIFYEEAVRILAQIDEARRAVVELEASPRGVLRVSAPLSFGRLHIVPALPEFLSRYPGMEIALSLSDQFVELVSNGIDVAIRIADLKDSSLIARKLMPMRRMVCASPEYLERRGTPNSPENLTRHDCLVLRFSALNEQWSPKEDEWIFDGQNGIEKIAVTGPLQSDDADALVAAAAEGLGLVLMPDWLVAREIESGALLPVLQGYEPRSSDVQRAIYAVYPSGRYNSPKLRVFIDFLSDRFKANRFDPS